MASGCYSTQHNTSSLHSHFLPTCLSLRGGGGGGRKINLVVGHQSYSLKALLLLLLSRSVMSDSVRPHRWQPTRLLHPQDSPGKNTGVGCHFLLQCKEVKSESEVTQSCLALHDPMDCSLPGSSIHGIFQARVLEWVATSVSSLKAAGK